MNNERMQALADFLDSDIDRMSELFEMDAEKACEEINAEGYDFTADELREFGKAVAQTSVAGNKSGELSEDELEQVSGGIVVLCGVLMVSVTTACAASIGKTLLKRGPFWNH